MGPTRRDRCFPVGRMLIPASLVGLALVLVVGQRTQAAEATKSEAADMAAVAKAARAALDGFLARARKDKALKPKDEKVVHIQARSTAKGIEVELRYETNDWWPDLPSKPKGPRPGNGSVRVRLAADPLKLSTPFLPPKDCYYALSAFTTTQPGVTVSLWSMTADPSAHRRLEQWFREEFKKAGITMSDKPATPTARGGTPPGPG